MKKGLTFGLIQTVAVLYIVIWTVSPPLEIDMIYRVLALGCAAVWAAVLFIRQNPITVEKEQLLAIGFMLMVVFVVYVETGDISKIIKQIAVFMLIICYLMNYFYRDSFDELKILIPIVLILCIIWNAKTVSVLIEDPTIARKIVRDDESIYGLLRQGVGGYSLVYTQVCIFPAVLAWVLKAFRNNKLYFILGTGWLVSYVMLIANAGYSLAIFATIASAIIFAVYKGKSVIKVFLMVFLIFCGSMLAILYIEEFRNTLLEIFDGTAVANKINDLVASSDSGEATGSILDRVNAYVGSIQTMFKYPIIGALWRGGGGGHSALLDTIARYGLFGGVMYGYMIYSTPNYYKSKYDNLYIRRMANATLSSLLLVSILDTFTYSFMTVILLVLPLFFEDIIKWTGAEKTQ